MFPLVYPGVLNFTIFLASLHNEFQTILWGNGNRLIRAALDEIPPGSKVLQPACVYGPFSIRLAEHLASSSSSSGGVLHVTDIAPIQVDTTRRKVAHLSNVTVNLADARVMPKHAPYDGTLGSPSSFFLIYIFFSYIP